MTGLCVDGIEFHFPNDWHVMRYDDSAFHRCQFQSFAGGSTAVDLIALAGDDLWLIEVKDYRRARSEKTISLEDEMAGKVRSSLAGLAAARVRANDAEEREFASRAMRAANIRIALHLEQSKHPNRLFPQVVDPLSTEIALKKALRAVDPHPLLVSKHSPGHSAAWSVA
jgi:hypothetical protein